MQLCAVQPEPASFIRTCAERGKEGRERAAAFTLHYLALPKVGFQISPRTAKSTGLDARLPIRSIRRNQQIETADKSFRCAATSACIKAISLLNLHAFITPRRPHEIKPNYLFWWENVQRVTVVHTSVYECTDYDILIIKHKVSTLFIDYMDDDNYDGNAIITVETSLPSFINITERGKCLVFL